MMLTVTVGLLVINDIFMTNGQFVVIERAIPSHHWRRPYDMSWYVMTLVRAPIDVTQVVLVMMLTATVGLLVINNDIFMTNGQFVVIEMNEDLT